MEEVVLVTQIDTNFKKKLLFKGTAVALFGIVPIVLAGLFFSTERITLWGLPIFFTGLFFIKMGLGPYRKISKQELNPNELIFTAKTLSYRIQKRNVFSLPISIIKTIDFKKESNIYGIRVHLRVPYSDKILLHNPSFNVDRFHEKSRKHFHCDFFFPFFYEKTFLSLREFEPLAENNLFKTSESI